MCSTQTFEVLPAAVETSVIRGTGDVLCRMLKVDRKY